MNNSQFNQDLFNQDHTYAEAAEYGVAFNWYNLMSLCWASVWIAVQSGSLHNLAADVTSAVSSLADGWTVIDKKYGNKTVVISLFIQGTSNSDLISRIDELKLRTQGIDSNFDINIWGKIRRYEATVVSITVPPFNKLVDFLEWIEMEILITSPHWKYKDMSQVYVQWMTADFSKVVTNEWTYKTYPIVELITNAWSTLSWISINMKKIWDASWYTISISETINPSSVVIFDFIEKKVTVNDVEVNFTGVMMPMQTGQSVFTFDLTWTINVNAYILHYPTFL